MTETVRTVQTGLSGGLLIAAPRLDDPNFKRMVVLIVAHEDTGAFGIVLGPAAEVSMAELCQTLDLTWERPDAPKVRYGGPCEPSHIWLLHGGPVPLSQAATIVPGVHVGSSKALIEELVRHPDVPVMAFSGYAGWGPGQVEREMQESSWLPGECSPDLLFDTSPEDVWEAALRKMDLPPEMIVTGRGASA